MSTGPHWKSPECVYCGETAYRYAKNSLGVMVYRCDKGCRRKFSEDAIRLAAEKKRVTERTALPRSYEWRPLEVKEWRPIR